MFVKDEDDLGMTASFGTKLDYKFLSPNQNINFFKVDYNSALHTQYQGESTNTEGILIIDQILVGSEKLSIILIITFFQITKTYYSEASLSFQSITLTLIAIGQSSKRTYIKIWD